MSTEHHRRMADACKALAHPIRVGILDHLCASPVPVSPKQLADELDEALGNVSYHMRVLLALSMVELARKEQRRGAIAHFYRPANGTRKVVDGLRSVT
jgi:DNA-binding transcriptional ArsR family regulator